MLLQELNMLDTPQLTELLTRCCGSSKWVNTMCTHFPMPDEATLLKRAAEIWFACEEVDWLQAFTHHPRIGDLQSLTQKFATTANLASAEQSLVKQTTQQVLEELAQANTLYEEKFGYIFIVCATGKSAHEMLQLLQQRLTNKPGDEIKIAMVEQHKITTLRLTKLLNT